ncbi:NirD/YgiW/YdeI family stress tolerance protein [Vibrio sp. TBV020]
MERVLFASTLLLISNTVFDAFNGLVSTALEAREESYAELTGNIVKSLGNETYLFKDQTDEIQIEIDREGWMGQDITRKDKDVIRGEIDPEWTTNQIDVDIIKKL